MALQLQVIVVAKHPVIPLYSLTGSCDIVIQYFLGHLSGNTCRADDQTFMKLLQVSTVGAGTHIVAVDPRT